MAENIIQSALRKVRETAAGIGKATQDTSGFIQQGRFTPVQGFQQAAAPVVQKFQQLQPAINIGLQIGSGITNRLLQQPIVPKPLQDIIEANRTEMVIPQGQKLQLGQVKFTKPTQPISYPTVGQTADFLKTAFITSPARLAAEKGVLTAEEARTGQPKVGIRPQQFTSERLGFIPQQIREPATRFLLGEEPLRSVQQAQPARTEEIVPIISPVVGEERARTIAPVLAALAIGGGAFADLPVGLGVDDLLKQAVKKGGKKITVEAEEKAIQFVTKEVEQRLVQQGVEKELAKTQAVEQAQKIVAQRIEALNLPKAPEVAKVEAPKLTKNEKIAQQEIENLTGTPAQKPLTARQAEQEYKLLDQTLATEQGLTAMPSELGKPLSAKEANKQAKEALKSLEERVGIADFVRNLGKPQTLQTFEQNSREYGKILEDQASGITRFGKSVSVEPSLKTKQKVQLRSERAKFIEEQQNAKEWAKAVFGEAQTRTYKEALDDLTKAVERNTNQKMFNLDTADNWKDKPVVRFMRETMPRIFQDVMGNTVGKDLKRKLLDPVFEANLKETAFLNKERADIKKLGIKAGSPDAKLIVRYGEGKMDAGDVIKQVGEVRASRIFNAAKVFREKYDTYWEMMNKVLTRNGYDPVPKRKDYFHHSEELSSAWEMFGAALKAENLPTDINGLTRDFKPGKSFFSAQLPRLGKEMEVDAIKSIDKYLNGVSKQIFRTDAAQALRSFENALREKYAGTQHLSNFVKNLGEYTNIYLGKKSSIDRTAEELGRGIFVVMDLLRQGFSSGVLGFNVGTALTQFLPTTQLLATTDKMSVLQALTGILRNAAKSDNLVEQSNFLLPRRGSDPLYRNAWQNTSEAGQWLSKTVDNFVSELVVRSKYLEGLKKGLSETDALKQANDYGRSVIGGRSAGEMPTLFSSKTLGALTQFQLEANNLLSFLAKDIPRLVDDERPSVVIKLDRPTPSTTGGGSASTPPPTPPTSPRSNSTEITQKVMRNAAIASKVGQFLIYAYIFNALYEKITGRRPGFDPIGLIQNTYEDLTNPDLPKYQAGKNLSQRLGNQIPFFPILFGGGQVPLAGALPDPEGVITGQTSLERETAKLPTLFIPGYGQAKKSVEGVLAFQRGASVTPKGEVRFAIERTPQNFLRTAIFGQYSTPEGQRYIQEGASPLGEKQSSAVLNSKNPQELFEEFQKLKEKRPEYQEPKASILDTLFSGKKTETPKEESDMVLIESKLEKRPDLATPTEIARWYSREISLDSNKPIYQQMIEQQKVWSRISDIENRDALTQTQKDQSIQLMLQQINITPQQYEYYKMAKQSNAVKEAFVTEIVNNIKANPNSTQQDILNTLATQRIEINGQKVLTSETISKLIDSGVISKAEGALLKRVQADATIKAAKGKKIKLKKVSLKAPKAIKTKAIKLKPIKVPKLTGLKPTKQRKTARLVVPRIKTPKLQTVKRNA